MAKDLVAGPKAALFSAIIQAAVDLSKLTARVAAAVAFALRAAI